MCINDTIKCIKRGWLFFFPANGGERLLDGAVGACTLAASDTGGCVVL